MTTVSIGITIEESLLQTVDADRGLVPRSRFLSKIVADAYEDKKRKGAKK